MAGSLAWDALPQLWSLRSGAVPPSVVDLVALAAFRDGIQEIGSGASHRHPTLEDLAPYAKSLNPVYRLIALRAIAKAYPKRIQQRPIEGHATLDRARVNQMQTYLQETDPLIVVELINALADIPCDQSKQSLDLLRKELTQRGAIDLMQKADVAIEKLNLSRAKIRSP